MKKFLFSLLFVFTLTASTVFADIVPTVRSTSSRSRIAEVQRALNECSDTYLSVDGVWGSRTTRAVRAFQRDNGISPVGFVGRLTAEALNDCLGNDDYDVSNDEDNTPLITNGTSTNNYTYSNTIPVLCSNGMTFASNCTQLPFYTNTNTTNNNVNTNYNYNTNYQLSGGEGSLVNINRLGYYNNTRVSAGDRDIRVLGVEVTARDADQRVEGLVLSFQNTNAATNRRLSRYASEIVVYLDGVEIGRKSTQSYSDETGDYTYIYRFTGMSGIVRRDQRAQITVAISGANTIDSIDAASDSWFVSFGTSINSGNDGNFISAVSGNGRYRDYGNDSTGSIYTSSLDFQQAGGLSSDQRYRVFVGNNNPNNATIQVSKTIPTNNQLLLAFDVRAENGSMKLQRLPITITTTGNGVGVVPNVSSIVRLVRLYANGTEITSESIPTGSSIHTVTFGNYSKMNYALPANSTVRFEVRADLEDIEPATGNPASEFDEGDMVRIDYTSNNVASTVVELNNYNEDTVYNRSGSVAGSEQTLRSVGAQTNLGQVTTSSNSNNNGDTISRLVSIPITIRAFDETLYVSQNALNSVVLSGTSAVGYIFEDTTGAEKAIANSATLSSTNATLQNGAYRIDAGSERQFIMTIVMNGVSGHATKQYRVQLTQIQTFTDSALTQGAQIQNLTPANAYETQYYTLSLN